VQRQSIRMQYAVLEQVAQKRAAAFQSAANGRDWIDVPAMASNIVFTAPEGQRLTPGVAYVFMIRVWATHTSFTQFVSSGITITPNGPQLSRKERLVETGATQSDVDHTTNVNSVTISFKGRKSPVFFDATNKQGAAIQKYEVCMGTKPGANDIRDYRLLDAGEVAKQSVSVSKLQLAQGQHYWVSMRATDVAGLHKVASTDGLRIDTTAPDSAGVVVMDGHVTRDLDYQASTSDLSGSWRGFGDAESGISKYMVGVVYVAPKGKLAPGAKPAAWKDNGIANHVSGLTGKSSIKAGTYYLMVKAVNGVGMESAVKMSDGIVVDATPPAGVQCSGNSATNLVKNAGLESGNSWSLKGRAAISPSTDPDGKNSASLPESGSSISQQIATQPGAMYRVAFSARVDTANEDITGASAGLLSVGPETFPFVAKRARADPTPQWREFEFQFVADSKQTEVFFAASKHANYMPDLLLNDVAVQLCSSTAATTVAVHAGPAFQSSLNTIAAQWGVQDLESGIVDSMWAVGTVDGGEQVAAYTSVGRRTHASASGLPLVHGEKLFVSVVTRNGAGLLTKLSSTPVTIDHTPPVIGRVLTGGAYQFQATSVSVQFPQAADPESGLEACEVAVGHSPDNHDVVKFTQMDGVAKAVAVKFPANKVVDRDTIYVTVRCSNNAGLASTAHSGSILILAKPPSSKGVALTILAASQKTVHPAQSGFQAVADVVHLAWEGFGDDGAALRFQVQVRGEGYKATWVDAGQRHAAKLDQLKLQQGKEYTVALRAIDGANRPSAETTAKVVVDGTAPVLAKDGKFCGTKSNGNEIDLTWANAFSDDVAGLTYEISVGTTSGAGSLVFRQPASSAAYKFKAPNDQRIGEVHIVVTAINKAGLATTMRSTVTLKKADSSTATC